MPRLLATKPALRRAVTGVVIALWFAAIYGTLLAVWNYMTIPGKPDEAPARWPLETRIARADRKPQLIVFAHPQCPCTRSTMSELGHLAVEMHGAAQIHVVLVRPDGTSPGFEEGAVADRARSLPGADVLVDVDGREAKRFGAMTSGATLLYSADGELIFHGGLTAARGHEGRAAATDRILAILGGEAPDRRDSPVFGCALWSSDVEVSVAR